MSARCAGTKVLILFLIVALLLPAVPLPAANAAAPVDPATSPETASFSPVPQEQVQGDGAPPLHWPALALTVQAAPEEVPAGGTVSITVRLANAGQTLIHSVVASGTLPLELECPVCGGFFDPGTRRLAWALPALEVGQALTRTFAIRVREEAAWQGGVALALGLRGAETPQATYGGVVVRVPYPVADGPAGAVLLPGQGGQLVSADGRMTVTFPAEAVPVSLTLAYSPTAAPVPPHRALRHFHLTATDPFGQQVHTFPAPVTIVYRYTWGEAYGLDPKELHLSRWDEEAAGWVRLPTEVDEERRLLVAQTDHFSEFVVEDYLPLPSEDYLPAVQGFQEIDLFSGASTYAYPITLPPGRGGLTPQLSLSYSSGSVDWPAWPFDPDAQAGWVGYGWNLGESYIGRQDVQGGGFIQDGCSEWTNDSRHYAFTLVLDGVGHDLVKGLDGYYHTSDETYWRIQSNGGESATQWIIQTKDGTTYTFATPLWQAVCTSGSPQPCDPCLDGDLQVYKVLLTQVQDTHGNSIQYEYAHTDAGTWCGPGDPRQLVYRETYLSQITYNGGLTKVEFARGSREDQYAREYAGRYPKSFMQTQKLDAVQVYQQIGGQWQEARHYFLWYDYTTYNDYTEAYPPQKKLTLRSVQSCGVDLAYLCLPAATFDYWPKEPSQVGRNRLKIARNGYGGEVQYNYEVVQLPSVTPYRKRVQSRIVTDGLGNSGTWWYSYTGEAKNNPHGNGNDELCIEPFSDDATEDSPRVRRWREFRGHSAVTVTDPSGNKQEHKFYQGDVNRGKEYEINFMDAAGTPYRKVVQAYTFHEITAAGNYYDFAVPEIAFTYVSRVDDYTYREDGSFDQKWTLYTYDTVYGNVTYIQDYHKVNGVDTVYRTIFRDHYPNPTAWIVDRVTGELVLVGADWGNVAALTWYYYDANTLPTQPPTVGDLQRVQRLIYTGSEGEWNYYDSSEVVYDYTDGYGNLTAERTNPDYGRMRQLNHDPWTIERLEYPDPAKERPIQIAYDSTFHLYPVTVSYPNGRSESATYDYRLGVLTSYTDMNGDTTQYRYDALSRLTKVWKPGDSENYPTVQVSYSCWGAPTLQHVLVQRRETSGGSGTLDEERYFDGLGRATQVHQEADGRQEVIATTLYDVLGRTTAEVVPYLAPSTDGYVDPGNHPRTQYTYDPLGRVYNTTNPDNTTVRTRYNGWQTAAIDENNHAVVRVNDAFGRLVQVREYTGAFGEPFDWDALPRPYATTSYSYDVRDLLTDVYDEAGNRTRMEYDQLGRKERMHDPDMSGSTNEADPAYWWTYEYDALDSLTRQTDAKGQRVCFYYDTMNRVLGKIYWSTDACPTPGPYTPLNVTFQYDNALGDANVAHSWGKLRRAYVGTVVTTNAHEYKYDGRGRTVWERVTLNGVNYETSYTYDALDRVTTMTYPGGEAVTYAYSARGLPQSLRYSSFYYVTGATYDALGRATEHTFGSGWQTIYTYYGPEENYRLQEVITARSEPLAAPVQRLWYDYDSVGNVTEIRDYPAGYGFDYQKLTFGYDDLDRLVSAKAEQGRPESNYDYTGGNGYSYNEIGNLVSKEGVGYTYPAPGQPHPHAVTTAGGSSYTYDNDGNMTSGAGRAITWDAENRPASITAGGQTTTFVYGPQGERVKVTVGTVTTVYVGDYYEKNLSTGVVTRYYTFGGQRVALRQGSTVYWIHADHLGSTAVVRDGEGNTVTRYYYPWGGLRPPVNGDAHTQRLYTGQLLDASTGLYYYGARYYDVALGRFISPDTIVPEPGNPQTLNRYAYCLNSPLRYMDPFGLFTDDAIITYLKGLYGDAWQYYWDLWNADANWMDLLHAAQAGDILAMMDKQGLYYYQFLGEGVDVLGGVVQSAGIVGSQTNPNISPALELLRFSSDVGGGLYRVGNFRMVNGHLTNPYKDPRVAVDLRTYDALDSTFLLATWALVIGIPGAAGGPLGYIAGSYAGSFGARALAGTRGGLEGDDLLYISLVVPGASGTSFYDAYIVVRGGQVLVNDFSYWLFFDEWLDVDCEGTCP
jgi:RHS repeat-associated protein